MSRSVIGTYLINSIHSAHILCPDSLINCELYSQFYNLQYDVWLTDWYVCSHNLYSLCSHIHVNEILIEPAKETMLSCKNYPFTQTKFKISICTNNIGVLLFSVERSLIIHNFHSS